MTSTARFSITIAMLLSSAAAARYAELPRPDKLRFPLAAISRQIDGWQTENDNLLRPSILTRLQPTAYLSRTYGNGATTLKLFVAYYAQQRAGEAMHSPKVCLPGSGWEIWKSDQVRIPAGNGFVTVNRTGIQKAGQKRIVVYWYQSGSRVIASEYTAKAQLFADAIFRGRTSGALVRIVMPDEPGSSELAVSFASRLLPELTRCWGE